MTSVLVNIPSCSTKYSLFTVKTKKNTASIHMVATPKKKKKKNKSIILPYIPCGHKIPFNKKITIFKSGDIQFSFFREVLFNKINDSGGQCCHINKFIIV